MLLPVLQAVKASRADKINAVKSNFFIKQASSWWL